MVNCFNFNYCLVAVLAIAATVDKHINAAAVPKNDKSSSCSTQLSAFMECEGAVQMSPEAAKIIQRKGQALKKCAPNYPQECVAGITKVLTCVYEIAKNAANDTEMSAAANKSLPAIDKCFADNPASPTQGVDQLFKPTQYHLSEDGQQKKSCADHGDGDGEIGSGAGTTPAAGGNKASSPNMDFGAGKKCAETKEQRQCIDKELSNDSEFVHSLNQLIAQKKKCSEGLTWLCTPNTPDQKRCVAEASKPCVELFMKRLFKCIGASYSTTTTTAAIVKTGG